MKKVLVSILAMILCQNALASEFDFKEHQERWSDFLPIWGSKAKEKGYDLPYPFGISINYSDISQQYQVLEGNFSIGKIQLSDKNVDFHDVTGSDKSVLVRADMWLFPFLNLFVITGKTEGEKKVSFSPNIGLPAIDKMNININLDYEGSNIGAGALLGGKVGPYITSLAVSYSYAQTNITDSTIKVLTSAVRVGRQFHLPNNFGVLTLMGGGMYQDMEQKTAGSLGDIKFDLLYKGQEEYNMFVTANWDVNKNISIMAEYGFYNWDHLITGVTYRF